MTFGQWFGPIIDGSGLKKKDIAKEAGINPVSLSRILSGDTGVAKETARDLVRSINKLAGRSLADEKAALQLAAGITEPEVFEEFDLGYGVTITFKSPLSDIQIKQIVFASKLAVAGVRAPKTDHEIVAAAVAIQGRLSESLRPAGGNVDFEDFADVQDLGMIDGFLLESLKRHSGNAGPVLKDWWEREGWPVSELSVPEFQDWDEMTIEEKAQELKSFRNSLFRHRKRHETP